MAGGESKSTTAEEEATPTPPALVKAEAPKKSTGRPKGSKNKQKSGVTTPTKQKSGLMPAWEKGKSGNPNGRPKGSRHRFSESLISAFCDDFERNGVQVIEAVRSEAPVDYLRLAVSIVPKQFGIEEGTQDAFLACWQAISDGTL